MRRTGDISEMASRALLFAAVVLTCSLNSLTVPAMTTTHRKGFIFAAAQDGSPVTVVSGIAPSIEPTSVPAPASPLISVEELYPVEIENELSASSELVLHASTDGILETPDREKVFTIAYNIGGDAYEKWAADPEEWVIGETATFNIPKAVIAGAEPGNTVMYKTHRYGLRGTAWGYDIAVNTAGLYDCTLHYAETYSNFFGNEPNRTFKVEISGDGDDDVIQSAEFDVMIELKGAEFTAYTKTFTNIAAVTMIKIRETPSRGDAFLSGISCSYISPVVMA